MTPLTREERDAILRAHPNAAPGEIEADIKEYEQLVSQMFATDPSAVHPTTIPRLTDPTVVEPAAALRRPIVPERLSELHAKLFG